MNPRTSSDLPSSRFAPLDEPALDRNRTKPTARLGSKGLLGLLAALTIIVLALVIVLPLGEEDRSRPGPSPAPQPEGGGPVTWMSGAAGEQTATGDFAEWRGSPTAIAGTWVDNNQAMVELWQLRGEGEYASWEQPLDIAVGAIGGSESWAEAAGGAYDDRWRESLTNLRDTWGARAGTVYIRFAHEMNGDWFPWAVTADNRLDFIEGWKRFRALQRDIFPAAQLIFCVNRVTVGSDIDWRDTFPGAEFVDVMGVDYYNSVADLSTDEQWEEAITRTDRYGAPDGIEAHRQFAASVGLPLAVPEWSGDADVADSAIFFTRMFEFFSANAGTGPGEILYEIIFNVDGYDDRFLLHPKTRMPASAEAYRRLW